MVNFLHIVFLLILFSHSKAFPIEKCETLDLTHALEYNMPFYPIYAPFELTIQSRGTGVLPGGLYLESNKICTYEHMGTHMDAPAHFAQNHPRTDKVPFKNLIGEACVIDISQKTRDNPDYLLTVEDMQDWELKNGPANDCIVLLQTGWDQFWSDPRKFFGTNDVTNSSTFHHPGFSGPVAEWLVKNRKLKAVGVDTISLDAGHDPSGTFPAHVAFLYADVPGFENVANLGKLPARGATVVAMPLKIKDGSGSPIRAFAVGWNGPNDPCNKRNAGTLASIQNALYGLCMLWLVCFM